MPADTDLLFGKIAIARGFCTEEQVDECLEKQASSKRPMPLGEHLLDLGFLNEDQHAKILQIQRDKLLDPDPVAGKSLDSVLFGKLAVSKGLLTEAQVNECLRRQAQAGEERSLGEVMVANHYLTSAQVKAILAEQCKTIMSCGLCMLSFTVLSTTRRKLVECPRCKLPLQEGKPSDSTRTDAELETQTAMSMKSEKEPVSAGSPSAGDRRIEATCKICSHRFEGILDSTNRLSCPSCLTRYVVRQTPS